MVHSTTCERPNFNACGGHELVLHELSAGDPSAVESNSPGIIVETVFDNDDDATVATRDEEMAGLTFLDMSHDSPDPYLC